MAQKVFIVEGRRFRTESDYALAKRDKELMDRLRGQTDQQNMASLEELRKALREGRYKFHTLLGQDFREEVEELIRKEKLKEKNGRQETKTAKTVKRGKQGEGTKSVSSVSSHGAGLDAIVENELRKREKRRKLTIAVCSLLAAGCLGYFGIYSYYNYRTNSNYRQLSELKEKPPVGDVVSGGKTDPLYTLDNGDETREVLEEYRNLLLKNRKLIGWVKIDGTYIDYPVMQTTDNEYYLDHNMNQEYDKNGTIFMDKDCDVLKPSTNYILYGHHMKNGRMFGQLDLYQKESYYKDHPYISFDTIYEKGTYQVMYVFRSKVYKETEIAFKYYQFIDANGEQEFASYMQEMAEMSFYDTGVTAEYGDQLLTLSTCDYQETDGRFVVVAKKIE